MDITTTIDNIKLTTPFYNASGVHCTHVNELNELNNNDYFGGLVTKSCTLYHRIGNREPRYFANSMGSINSSGLPNQGYSYYSDWMRNTELKKHCFLSTAPTSISDLTTITNNISNSPWITYPEYNFSCPNLVGTMQLGYSIDTTNEYLRKITEILGDKKFGIKLPPYFEEYNFDTMTDIIKNYKSIKYLTCINSIGNGMLIDTNTECVKILPKNGLGGIGGKYCLPIALSNVYQFKRRLPELDIIGCGGIYTGDDAFQHILAGASAVQIGTCLKENGTDSIKRIHDEFIDIMRTKRYHNLTNIIGKVKILT